MLSTKSALLLLALFALCLSPLAFAQAQSATASLSGTVEDANGAVVPGAIVTVLNSSTGLQRQATTGDGGNFVIPLLPPSTYTVTIGRQGFSPAEIKDVVLNVGDQRSLQIQLKVGQIGSETITVKADGNAVREDPSVATVIDRQFVENLPLSGRSFQSLINLTPGVVVVPVNGSSLGQFSVNGQRSNANYFTVDGVSANTAMNSGQNLSQAGAGSIPALTAIGTTQNLISVDAMEEFKIQTSTFAPEYGRTPGAQVSIVSRSGNNEFRGTLFEFFRNEALDANNWFANRSGLKRAPQRQNDFGGVLGGPIIKNHVFFFGSYEALLLERPTVTTLTVPTVSARESAPAQVRPFLDIYPLPNGRDLGNGRAERIASFSNPATIHSGSVRVDHAFSSQLTLFGRYAQSFSESESGSYSVNRTENSSLTFTGGATWALSPTLNNDFRANFTRTTGINDFTLVEFGGSKPPDNATLFPSYASFDNALFFFIVNGASNFVLGKNGDSRQRQVNFVDTLSWATGAHSVRAGVDYRRLSPIFDPLQFAFILSFNGFTGASGVPPDGSVLSGKVSTLQILNRSGKRFLTFNNFSSFVQDTWKVSRRLTLTYGMRHEVNPPPYESTGKEPFVFIGLDDPRNLRLAPSGTKLYDTTWNNFAPRFGAAWHVSDQQGRQTILRGGIGLFYDLGNGSVSRVFESVPPYTAEGLTRNSPFPLTAATNPPPTLPPSAPYGFVFAVNPQLKLPYAWQWNVTLEQLLGSNTFSAGYVAAVGRRLVNQTSLLRPNPTFSSTVSIVDNTGSSDYHAMQLQFQRRLSRGLQALASYTWSHSIDTASSDTAGRPPTNIIGAERFRGPSDFDIRHSFSGAVTYELPSLRAGAIVNAVLNGWATDTTLVARSGVPVDIGAFRDLGFGFNFFSPDLVTGVPLYIDDPTAPRGRRFNRNAFSLPTELRNGNLGRNFLRGFGAWQVDFALRRRFKLTERFNLQFRSEFFNVFNHPNFGAPSGNLSSPTFGISTQMLGSSLDVFNGLNPLYQIGGPRSIQFALKLSF
ncbi:TonB-dependent receptor [soil metagenome]